jgi:3-deoxy-D-manno-octulosonic-acid transferase
MGEFEQAKPVVEYIKATHPNIRIVCTFFSPSGYNTQRQYKFADAICYLPMDTYWNVQHFISAVKPIAVVFVRYEIWLNYLSALHNANIPTYLINATYPTILGKVGIAKPFYKLCFNKFTKIYAVNTDEYAKFLSLQLDTEIISSSDTRMDRIMAKVTDAQATPVVSRSLFGDDKLVLVAGSVWNEDVDVIVAAVQMLGEHNIRIIFVPHEPTTEHIQYIQRMLPASVLLSEIGAQQIDCDVIVDSIGKLLKLYGIADIAYIGGAFGVGVHSITEPAGYGIPLATGSNCFNSPDTKPLLATGALTIIHNADMLCNWFKEVADANVRLRMGNAASKYIAENTGTSKVIAEVIVGG